MDGLRFIDLFAGIGGFHHALGPEGLGGRCVLAVELDQRCREVYAASFKDMDRNDIRGDIRSITREVDGSESSLADIADRVPDHEVLCAGFPCQPFSKSGAQLGVRDQTRGTLFFDIMEIVRAKRPDYLILENVRNLAGPRHRDTWRTIVRSIRDAGYRVADEPVVFSPHLLREELGGAPQVRDRVFILAERVGADQSKVHPEPLVRYQPSPKWDPHSWDIEKFIDRTQDIPDIRRYELRAEELMWLEAWQDFVKRVPSNESLPGFPIWVDAFVADPDTAGQPKWKANFLRKNSDFYLKHRDEIDEWRQTRWEPLGQAVDEFPASRRKFEWQATSYRQKRRDIFKLVIQMRPSGIRVRPPTYLPALVAITQTSIIGSQRRRITPREAARLQGIDDPAFERAGIKDQIAYRQLGNAVNVGVVRHVAQALLAAADAPPARAEVLPLPFPMAAD
jgi:DNA (cytosine-5)-methyltransferase 1